MLVNRQKIKQNGWKQGACLQVDKSMEIYASTKSMQERLSEGLYFVLSQDCDILNSSLQKEPVVELISANQIAQCTNEFTTGKNPRQLHIKLAQGSQHLEFLPHNRLFIARTYLEKYLVSETGLSKQQLKILVLWTAKRYKRSAFPDTFNERCEPIVNQIKQIFRNAAKHTHGLFIYLFSERELEPNEPYKIILKLLVKKSIYEDQEELSIIQGGFDEILALFDGIKGIEVITNLQNIGGSQVQSMDDITVHRFQELKQWDFDYISFSNGEDGETINDAIL